MQRSLYRPERDEHCFELRRTASTKYADDYDEVALWGLSSEENRQLIRTILNANTLPFDIEEKIIEKAEGNPLFLLEILKSLQDAGKLVRVEGRDIPSIGMEDKNSHVASVKWELCREVFASLTDDFVLRETLQVPDTIHSVIMSRIDRLEAGAKQTLQYTSVNPCSQKRKS